MTHKTTMQDLIIHTPQTAALSVSNHEALATLIDSSRSARTKAIYATAWQQFVDWSENNGTTPLPASPLDVGDYIAQLVEQKAKPATIQLKVSAISNAHRAKHAPNPVESEIVRKAMSGMRRTLTTKRTQKAPIALDELKAMIEATDPKSTAGLRDRAVLLLGFAGAFRRSEIAGLMREDVVIKPAEMRITLAHSKTDQEGEGTIKRIKPLKNAELCPVRALQAWLKVSGIQDGPLFRAVDRWGAIRKSAMNSHAIAEIVKAAATRAGLDSELFSGHSLRAGFVTASYNAGTGEANIMEITGHKSLAIMRGYKRNAATSQPSTVAAAFGE